MSIGLLFISCEKSEREYTEEILKIDAQINQTIKLSRVCSDLNYLLLDGDERDFISQVNLLKYNSNDLMVFDQQQKKIFHFTIAGKKINAFKIKEGRGPNELLWISDIDVNWKRREIAVLGFAKIVFYDFKGNPVKELQLENTPIKLAVYDGNLVLLYRNSKRIDKPSLEPGYKIVLIDRDGNILNRFVEKRNAGSEFDFLTFDNFPIYQDMQLVLIPPEYNIYRFKSLDELAIKYRIDFGDEALPDDFFSEYITPESAYSAAREKEYASIISTFLETDNLIYFQFFMEKNQKAKMVFYSKKSGNHIVGRTIQNDMDDYINSPRFLFGMNNFLIQPLLYHDLKNSVNDLSHIINNIDKGQPDEFDTVLMLCNAQLNTQQ